MRHSRRPRSPHPPTTRTRPRPSASTTVPARSPSGRTSAARPPRSSSSPARRRPAKTESCSSPTTSTTRRPSPAPAGCSRSSPSSATRAAASSARRPGPLHNEIPEPDRAVNNSTHWVPDFNQASLRGPVLRRRRVVRRLLLEAVVGQLHRRRRGQRLGEGARQRLDLRRQRGRGLRRRVAVHRGHRQRLVRRQDRGRQVATTRSRPSSPRSTCGTATTPTATATSTSPTATSTTSRPCTPARARTPAAAPRAKTPSGRTAGTSTPPTTARPAPTGAKFGGAQIGDTGFWIGDYTVEAENGGLGVFAHEYGHDLGLPDFYDTDGGENGTAFWTLMSSGSWLNHGADDIGTTPGLHGPVGEAPARLARLLGREPGHDGCPTRSARPRCRPTARTRRSSSTCPTSPSRTPTRRPTSGTRPGGPPAPTT